LFERDFFDYASAVFAENDIISLDISLYGIMKRFEQYGLSDFCFCFIGSFAEFAFRAGSIHAVQTVLKTVVFVRHTIM